MFLYSFGRQQLPMAHVPLLRHILCFQDFLFHHHSTREVPLRWQAPGLGILGAEKHCHAFGNYAFLTGEVVLRYHSLSSYI